MVYNAAYCFFYYCVSCFAWTKGSEMQQQEKQYQAENSTTLEGNWDQVKKTADKVEKLIAEKKFKETLN